MSGARFGVMLITAWSVMGGQREKAFDLNERGVQASARGEYVEAERLYNQALAVWQELGPSYDAHAGTTLYNLGEALVGQGRWRDSTPFFEDGLARDRRLLGIGHNQSLATLNVLGNVYMVVGDTEKAEAVFQEALPVERNVCPKGMEMARTLGGLAALRVREQKLDEALTFAEEALQIAVQDLGDDNADTGTLYANVAAVHRRAGRPERAVPLFRKAHAIYERTVAPDNPMFATLVSQEGLALMQDGQVRAAEKQLTQAVEMLSHCSGCNFALAMAENNLSLLRIRQGKYGDADRLLTSALALEEQFSERHGPDMAGVLELLSEVREKQRRFDDAALLKRRAAALQSYR